MKVTDLFKEALAAAMKGDEDLAREYLMEYEDRILANAREVDNLKRKGEMLDSEHGAICVAIAAFRKGAK